MWPYWRGSTVYLFFSFSCRKFCSAFHLNQWLAGRHFHKGIFIVCKINNIINVSIYDYRKQSAWFFPLEMYSYSLLRVLCNTLCFSDYSIKVFYGSGECLVLNIPTSDSDDIPEIVRRLEEISIGCQVKLFFCHSSSYIGKHCPLKSNCSFPAWLGVGGENPLPALPKPLPFSLSRNPLSLSAPAMRAKLAGELSWQSVCLLSGNESRGNQPMTFRIIFLTGNWWYNILNLSNNS